MPAAVHGGTAVRKRLTVAQRNAKAEMLQQLDENAEDLLSRARQLAPQLSGELIESGIIKRRGSKHFLSRTILFTACHAVRRHEDFYNLGPISSVKSSEDGPIGRKYLERPFNLHKQRYFESARDAVRRGLRQSMR